MTNPQRGTARGKKKDNLKSSQYVSTAENLSPVTSTISSPTVPDATEQKPESSQNKSSAEPAASESVKVSTAGSPQPQISEDSRSPPITEEDRKALENLATAIGIPQIVAEIKRIGEQVNVLLGAKTGIPGIPAVGGVAAGFLKPIMDKAPELIDGIMKWISGTSSPAPTMISGIDKEIMEAAIKQTMEVKQKVALANEALARIYMGGGSVMVDSQGNAVILKPKTKEEEKKE